MDRDIEELGMPTYTTNCLKKGGINTVGQMVDRYFDGTLSPIFGYGSKSHGEVTTAIMKLGLKKNICELNLSCRTYNCLMRAGIDSIGELRRRYLDGSLLKVRNFGNKCNDEVAEKLKELGL